MGYLSYDLVRQREKIPLTVEDDLQVPDLLFGLYDSLLVFDPLRQRIQLLALIRTEEHKGTPRQQYREACRRIQEMEQTLAWRGPRRRVRPASILKNRPSPTRSAAEYRSAVGAARRAIAAGEVFQVVLSRRFERQSSHQRRPVIQARALC